MNLEPSVPSSVPTNVDSEDDVTISVDIDRLLLLVQSHPALYNATLKEYHMTDVISKIWTEIGKELNVPGKVCKSKWMNLRGSYTRYLREMKKLPSGSAQRKKKWHLADALSFLHPYAGAVRKQTSLSDDTPQYASTSTFQPELQSRLLPTNVNNHPSQCNVEEFVPRRKKQKTATELLATPIAEFLRTATVKRAVHEESNMLTFFKSLLPDAEELTNSRKRRFKSYVMETLHCMLDEQEAEERAKSSNIQLPTCSRPAPTELSSSNNTPEHRQQTDNHHFLTL